MSGDKRSVATDALETLGTAPISEGSGRDAIHLAVEPVIAGETLLAGMHIGLRDGRAYNSEVLQHVGIVDPFVRAPILTGQKFWLVVYPRQITSLRHVWTHPAFEKAAQPEPPPISEEDRKRAEYVTERLLRTSENWLRDFCRNNDAPDYDVLMKAIKSENGEATGYEGEDENSWSYSISIDEESVYVGGSNAHGTIPPEFWDHVEKVTGKKQLLRPGYFRCSC